MDDPIVYWRLVGTANRGIFLAFLPLGSSELLYRDTCKVKKNTLKTINFLKIGWKNIFKLHMELDLSAVVYKFDC